MAIRRRFGLYPLEAKPEVVEHEWSMVAGSGSYGANLASLMKKVNNKLVDGHAHTAALELGVGHSYFLPTHDVSFEEAKRLVRNKWSYQVRPLLRKFALHFDLITDLQEFDKELDACLTQP